MKLKCGLNYCFDMSSPLLNQSNQHKETGRNNGSLNADTQITTFGRTNDPLRFHLRILSGASSYVFFCGGMNQRRANECNLGGYTWQ